MKKHLDKKNYSTRKTLLHLQDKIKEGYEFTTGKKCTWMQMEFAKNTVIKISEIILKEESSKTTHKVKFTAKNGKKEKNYEISGGIFMRTFVDTLPEKDIILKHIENTKQNIHTTLKK